MPPGENSVIRVAITTAAVFLVFIGAVTLAGTPNSSPALQIFFRQNIGLSQDQIAEIQEGRAVVKALPSRTPAEVFLFGAIYVHATPESYLQFSHDFNRLRKLPNYLALGVFSDPPQPSDLKGFSLDEGDIRALRNCKPGDCLIQMPASAMGEIQQDINWSATDVNDQVNRYLQKSVLQQLLAYQREGNAALGVYNDKQDPTKVPQQFAYMLTNDKALPEYLPDFYQYLLSYPNGKRPNLQDTFYWAKVKFGLKPTLRLVQMVTMRGNPGDEVAYAIAEKQLYSSHYFETALDLSFCVRGSDDSAKPGFYLIMAMGSEQAGLTGAKGFIVRKTAVGRSISSLQDSLTAIRNTLESKSSVRLDGDASNNPTTEVSRARY